MGLFTGSDAKVKAVRATSNSENNPGREYWACAKKECDFFQWVDEVPKQHGMTQATIGFGRADAGF